MKTYQKIQLLFALSLLSMMTACERDRIRDSIPGTYVNSAGGEFSKADDTLEIEAAAGNQFLIHRRTGFNLIEYGKLGARQFQKEEWRAVYDESTKILTEAVKGKLISLYPDSGYLTVGKRKYQKK